MNFFLGANLNRNCILVSLLGLFLFTGCASRSDKPTEYLMGSTLWFQTSGEARALHYQSFNLAKRVLDLDLRKRSRSKRAIVVDVDETVLDNSPYEGRVIKTGESYPVKWDEWVDSATAKPIPGSLEFLKYADSKGVKIFYITNRKQKRFDATLKNLKEVGFPNATKESLFCRTGPTSKTDRRDMVRKNHRIVMLIGDNLNDFSYLYEKNTLVDRAKAVDEAKDRFGTEFIVIANPMYGAWEAVVYQNDFSIPADEKARLRMNSLSIFEESPKTKAAD